MAASDVPRMKRRSGLEMKDPITKPMLGWIAIAFEVKAIFFIALGSKESGGGECMVSTIVGERLSSFLIPCPIVSQSVLWASSQK